jgi:hypothetical protein
LNCYGISDGGYYPNGEYTITGCIQPDTFGSDDGGTFTVVSYGTPCTTTTSTSTSTTTFSPDPCICTEVVITSAGGEVETFNCFGVNENYVYMNAGTYYICAASLGGLLQAFFAEGTTGTISPVGNCKTGTCPPPTTTSTSTTSTSTTSTSTTSTSTTTAAPAACVINTTINVTDTGWIRWTNCYGDVVDTFLSSLGTYTITQCIQSNTIRAAVPLADLADWNNVVWGTACTTTTSTTSTTTTPPTTALFNWNFIEELGTGEMVLYINGDVVENRFITSNGTYNVSEGDTINCEIVNSGCTAPNSAANVYTIGIINDASCGTGSTSLFTSNYTVTSFDIGNTITLSMYSDCDTGCV